ncbi:probable mitochondrial saccharopine dehydrogenase-like oxidoreductase At5g39410 [Ipomoea triloba]|uniref:probable mitochondrial saccharopine dehydrogenase-like oxidoreductase At5g39410 n=1 Tax=Ipomoea triloba TaxID=35885 RepID=UPI00125D9A85|nr:probable mitochondrial saccharopine dehydrogenase-like oxidoreductase At5g39410 [Ipomoea triloba]
MEDQRYDIVIFGASGFTGKYVIREALKFLNAPSSPLKSLALVGRNPSKVAQALEWASHPNPPPPQIAILTADITADDRSSLRRIASRAKIVLNCAGPFHLYGEPVVAACVDAGCDYLDITGEVEFPERIEACYQEKAAANSSLVVCACGYDALVAELALMFNSRQWVSPAAPNRVEAYLSLESDKRVVFNQTSFDSLVHDVANEDNLQQLRRSKPARAHPVIPGPPPKGKILEYKKEIGLWAVMFPSLEVPAVQRTLGFLTENPKGAPGVNGSAQQIEKRQAFWSTMKPAHFATNWTSKSFLGVIRYIIIGMWIGLLGRFCIGRWLLMRFRPVFSLGLFSNGGPTEEEVASASFKRWCIGHGYSDASLLASKGSMKPDMKIITRVTGPEIGYSATPITLIQSALVLLNQRHDLPKGGVFPAGIIFGHTDLQQRLQQNGISFDVISKETFPKKI